MQLLNFYRLVSIILILAILSAIYPMSTAYANVPICTDGYSARAGTAAGCAARTLANGTPIPYAKLNWETLGSIESILATSDSDILSETSAITLADKAAVSLGMDSDELASAIQMFPANVPIVLARFNPMENKLRVDIFKLEKALIDGKFSTGLFHSTFGPGHGDYWKASRLYISPDQQDNGMTPGMNPFEKFKDASDPNVFKDITIVGAMIAVGHAQRLVKAPVSALSVASTRIESRIKKKKSVFKRTITQYIEGWAKPMWYLGYPPQMQVGQNQLAVAQMCVNSPESDAECPIYNVASAGVVFEQFEGGTLQDFENFWELYKKKKSGLGFLAILVIGVALSFTIAGAAAAMGAGAGGMGALGGMAFGAMGATSAGLAVAIGVEVILVGGALMLAGANFGSSLRLSGAEAHTLKPGIALQEQGELERFERKLNDRVAPLMTGAPLHAHPSLGAIDGTIKGGCAVNSTLAECDPGNSGVIQKVDQYVEQNQVEFIRDNHGSILRNGN